MRFRQFADETTSRSYRGYWQTWPATSYEDIQYLEQRVRRTSAMVDVVTPNYLTVRNKGGIVCSPKYKEELYSCQDFSVLRMDGQKGGTTIKCETYFIDLLEPSVQPKLVNLSLAAMDEMYLLFSRETDLAIQRAHADVDVSEMMLLASLGELPETLAWLANLIKRVTKVVQTLRKKREIVNILRKLKYDAAESGSRTVIQQLERYMEVLAKRKLRKSASKSDLASLDAIANAWLEMRYAIRPLISDIQNALKALSTKLESARLTARGHENRIGESEYTRQKTISYRSYRVDLTAVVKEAESVKARAGCLYALDANIASFEAIFGLDQIVESAYELIPFSFIFDWVFSMGDLLQGMFKSSGLNILTVWASLELKRQRKTTITNFTVTGRGGYEWSNVSTELGSCTEWEVWKWRKPEPEFPTLPRLDIKLNLAKILDLGLIGRALLGGKSVPQVTWRE